MPRSFQPFGIHVQTARAVLHDLGIPVLAFAAEKPIDKHFGGVGMGRILDDAEDAEAIARRQAFFGRRHRFQRQPRFDEGIGLTSPNPKATATLPLANASASWRRSRVKKSSCWTNFLRNSSPLSSHMNDQIDCPELGTRGSLKPILPFHLGFIVVVEASEFLGFRQAGVVPDAMGRSRRREMNIKTYAC